MSEAPNGFVFTALDAALAAGEVIRKNFGQFQHVTYKDDKSVVTQTDVEAEQIILRAIIQSYPSHTIFSEEKGWRRQSLSSYVWLVDAIDGTSNFARGIPHFNISISLQREGKTIVGVVYQPMTHELFYARVGGGAFLNGKKIQCSTFDDLGKSFVILNRSGGKKERLRHAMIYEFITPRVRTLRVLGACAVDTCYCACGRFDAMINSDSKPHDCAAGNLIAKEAGAMATNFQGEAPKSIEIEDFLIAGPVLHRELLKLFEEFHRIHPVASPQR